MPIVLAMAIGLGSGLMLAKPMADLITRPIGTSFTGLSNPFSGWTVGSSDDILVLGTDVGGGNTDVIATLRLDGGFTRITQIPRDTYVEAQTYGPVKINALYSLGGIDTIKQEISSRTGRPLRHHIIVNLAGIRHMADQLGGIEVNVPKRMAYIDNSQGLRIDLQPGPQTLRGRDLEGFLRFRHDEMGDIGRLERQQIALRALFHKLTRPEQLVRLPGLLATAGKDLRTDMGPMELGGLITAMGTTQLDTRRLGGVPFYRNGISYWDAEWPSLASQSATDNRQARGDSRGDRHRFLF